METTREQSPITHYRQLTVSDLMSRNVFTLYEEDSLRTLDNIMKWQNIRHIPVVDDDNHVVGLMTHRDFLKIAISRLADIQKDEENELYSKIRVGDVMGRKVCCVLPETLLSDAASIIIKGKYGCLPVVDKEKKLVGIITEADFVKSYLN